MMKMAMLDFACLRTTATNCNKIRSDKVISALHCHNGTTALRGDRWPGMADLKMIIFTDAESSVEPDATGSYLKSATARRNDIMFTGPVYGYLDNDTVIASYPLSNPEVVTFNGVDVNFTTTDESVDPHTASAAPGKDIMWTPPSTEYYKNTSVYGQGKSSISVSPPLAGVQADLWDSPPAASLFGSAFGSVTAGLVDCGIGLKPCTGAKVGGQIMEKLLPVSMWVMDHF
jgi:hypothetical protein